MSLSQELDIMSRELENAIKELSHIEQCDFSQSQSSNSPSEVKQELVKHLNSLVPIEYQTPSFTSDINQLVDRKFPEWWSAYQAPNGFNSTLQNHLVTCRILQVELELVSQIKTILEKHFSTDHKLKDIGTTVQSLTSKCKEIEKTILSLKNKH